MFFAGLIWAYLLDKKFEKNQPDTIKKIVINYDKNKGVFRISNEKEI